MHWYAYPDPKTAAEVCAGFIIARLEEALSGKEQATLAISGGSTPKPMFDTLAARRFPWDRVHVFWVDERAVPPTAPPEQLQTGGGNLSDPGAVCRSATFTAFRRN